ncbi:alpha/beta hydrolase family protein [Actinomycetospora aeridis]|uniref:Dipeptidyl aminopeptidase n=1 Tax=Actinomycetospora aeridis TaxID=3129231 RepID=A0ABU8ND78_9PSEU
MTTSTKSTPGVAFTGDTGPVLRTGDASFDAQLNRSMTAAMRGSADLGEVGATAGRITPGDLGSWLREWRATAEAVRAEGDASLAAGHRVSARRCYLRAAEYHRQSFFFARDDLTRQDLQDAYTAHVDAFRAAAALMDHHVETVEIERDGVVAAGYLFRPAGPDVPRPTVIAPAGYDSTAEAGYLDAALGALEQGWNCLSVEGPGQGGVLYRRGLPLRPDYEAVLRPVVDDLVGRPGVDPAALVLLGRSFAGYLAPRGVTGEPRIAALVCDPGQYDFGQALRGRLGDAVWQRLQDDDPTLEADLAGTLLADPQRSNDFRWRMAAHGVTTLTDYFRALSGFSLAWLADRITCPVLVVEPEGDFASTGQAEPLAAAVGGPVTRHAFTAAEGAGGHCEGLGQFRFERVAHDWIADTLGR